MKKSKKYLICSLLFSLIALGICWVMAYHVYDVLRYTKIALFFTILSLGIAIGFLVKYFKETR